MASNLVLIFDPLRSGTSNAQSLIYHNYRRIGQFSRIIPTNAIKSGNDDTSPATTRNDPWSTMNTATDDRIFNLWTTMFLHYVPEGAARNQGRLVAMATQSPESDILAKDDPAADWLRTHIQGAAKAYLERCAEISDFTVIAQAIVHEHGAYRPLRNHPDAYLSGIYFITAPEGIRDAHHRFDVSSNAISFYDPRYGMNMGAIAKDPNANLEKQVQPAPGMLMLWPSYVDFFIHPNLSSEKAVSVHFKIIVDRAP
jgi:hypothetical protein